MSRFHIEPAANVRLDEIYEYTATRWSEEQADRYIRGLFECFSEIAARRMPWRAIPIVYKVDGYFCRYERHFIYWKQRGDGAIAIALILHERMDQATHLREVFGG